MQGMSAMSCIAVIFKFHICTYCSYQ